MKILAIAGRNLASLGSFAVNLDQDPFDREGLFAITGPTGAGKSTILDAMCVALFDRIPRLQDASNRLKLNSEDDNPYTSLSLADPRQIMRRGAKSCFAATTFTSSDGYRYCARWEILPRVRKSKTLNDPSISLENLDTEQLYSGKKSEVLPLIQEKVGLTFDQFCRSVLLAQGDFAAFLKAGGDARAELLERMTGTEIYAELSIAAFQRSKEEQQKLVDLQTQMDARPTLSLEDRTALEEKRANQEAELASTKAAWDAQNRLVNAFEKHIALEQAHTRAKTTLDQVHQAWELLAPQRQELQRWDDLGKARQYWADCNRLAQEKAKLQNLQATSQESITQLEAETKAKQDAQDSTQTRRTELDNETEALKPQLDAARKLDHALETTAVAKSKVSEEVASSENGMATLRAELKSFETELENLAQRQTIAKSQMDLLQAIEPLVGAWPSTQQQLLRLLEIRGQLMRDTQSLTAQIFANQQQDAQAETLCRRIAHSKQGLASLVQSEKEQTPGDGNTREAWTARQRDYLADEKLFTQIRELAKDAARFVMEADGIATERNALGERSAARQAFSTSLQKVFPLKKGQLEEAKTHLERLLLASSESAEAMRSQLVEDHPCPVCGSKDHPFATDSRFDDLTESTRARVAELEHEVQNLISQEKTLDNETARDDEVGRKLQTQWETLQVKLEQLESQFSSLKEHKQPPILHALSAPDMQETLVTWQADLERREAELESAHQALRQQEQQVKVWETARNLAQELLHRDMHQLQALEKQQREGSYKVESLQSNLDQLGQEAARLMKPLMDLLGEDRLWLKSLAEGSVHFVRQLGEKVATLQAARTSLDTSQQLVQEISAKRDVKCKELELQESRTKVLQTEQQNLETEWAQLTAQRSQIFSGRPVKQVEDDHAQKVADLKEVWEMQRQELVQTQQGLAEMKSLYRQNQASLQSVSAELDAAQQSFHQELALHGFQPETVEEDLERSPAWATTVRNEIADTKSRLDQAVGAEKAAREQLLAHRENFKAEGTLEEASEQRALVQAQRDQCESQLAETRHQLQSDDAAKAHLGGLLNLYEAQAAQAELWGSMKDLIGSADGKKFRIYAQSLTLEMLLHHANHHLADLARRYRLERLPGTDLALRVIDQDMGDEIRSVSSLSGGETFLVSLALALGLATFTTSQTPIESLFIDEGFGSLDAESLDLALDALEALQAQGRQVGIISHVQTLMERIAAQVQVRKCGGGKSDVQVCFMGNPVPS